MSTAGPRVTTATDGAVRVLLMARPEARNAMDTAMLSALLDALADAVGDAEIRAIVLSGQGGAFSAGADLHEPLDHQGLVRRTELFAEVYEAVTICPKPTIAAVSGPCVGGGAEVAAGCDLRVADPTATFRFPGAALGFPVGPARLVGLVGLGNAKDLVLTSRTIDVAEALRVGLVQRVTDAGEALATATAIAHAIAANNRHAVAFLKQQFARFSGVGDRTAAENDALRGLAEAGGNYDALTMPDPKRVGGWGTTTFENR